MEVSVFRSLYGGLRMEVSVCRSPYGGLRMEVFIYSLTLFGKTVTCQITKVV